MSKRGEKVTEHDEKMTEHDKQVTRNDTPATYASKVPASLKNDDRVRFTEIATILGELPNTVSARYFPRVLQAHEGLRQAPRLQYAPGKPTGAAARAIAEYLDLGRDVDVYRAVLLERYAPEPVEEPAAGTDATGEPATTPAQITIFQAPGPLQLPEPFTKQLGDRVFNAEDRKLAILAKVGLTIEAYKLQVEQIDNSEDRAVFEEAFADEFSQLGEELRKKMLANQARVTARELFKQQMEGEEPPAS